MSEQEAGSELWTKGVIEQNQRWLHAYLYAATGDYHIAEDLVQETFRIAYEKRNDFDGEHAFGAWLRGIARNVLKRRRRDQSRQSWVVPMECIEQMEGAAADLEGEHVDDEEEGRRASALQLCLARLREKSRKLLNLHYVEEWTLAHIAKETGMTLSNAGVTVFRARMAVAECVRRRLSLNEGGAP